MVRLRAGLWAETVSGLRVCGAGERECVAYWLGAAGDDGSADELVHPRHDATAYSYELDERWLNTFWLDLARRRRSVRVQVHTHGGVAGHSPTDDRWPIVHVPGFMSLVVPDFAVAPVRLDRLYFAIIQRSGAWAQARPTEHIEGLA